MHVYNLINMYRNEIINWETPAKILKGIAGAGAETNVHVVHDFIQTKFIFNQKNTFKYVAIFMYSPFTNDGT